MQGRLRPSLSPGYGYTGFLISWMAGGQPLGIVAAAFLLAVVTGGGDILQMTQALPGSVANILMAVILFVVLGRAGGRADDRPRMRSLLSGAVLSGTPLLYATLAELIGERAGIVNLGLEGVMLMGAVTAFVATVQHGQRGRSASLPGRSPAPLFNMIFAFLVVTGGPTSSRAASPSCSAAWG